MLYAIRKILNFFPAILETSKKFLVNLAVISLICEQFIFISASTARAADFPLTPDGTTNTQIDHAANGATIVNIAAPNAGGISVNRFDQMNFNSNGTIFNNGIGSPNDVYQTQLGGLIRDNPNLLNSGPSTTILSENTGRNITHFGGAIEVGKFKANLVFSNPYGFEVNGGSFVNTDYVTMVAGSVNGNNPTPGNLSFSLGASDSTNQPILSKILIIGAGLDLSTVAYSDLVATAMNIVAPIYGGTNQVNIRTGDKEFNYATKEVTSYANTTNPPPDAVAIDASVAGVFQAGKIFIIVTKDGYGMKWPADLLAQRGGVNIDAMGNIYYGNVASTTGDIDVTSRQGSINGTGTVINQAGNVNLAAGTDINNSGSIITYTGTINLTSNLGNINNNVDGNIINGSGNINLTSNLGSISNNGNILNNLGDLNLTALNGTINNGSLGASSNSNTLIQAETGIINLNSSNTNNYASVIGNNIVNLTTKNNLNNSGQIISNNNDVNLTADILNNSGSIISNNSLTADTVSFNSNSSPSSQIINSGTIAAANILTLNSLTLNNNQNLISNNILTINTRNLTNGINGEITAGSILNINASNSVTNNQNIISNGTLTINVPTLNNNGQIAAIGNVTINANTINNNVLNNSNILSLNSINLNTNNLNNSNGQIQAGNILNLNPLINSVAVNSGLNSNASILAFTLSAASVNPITGLSNNNGTFFAASSIDFNLGNLANFTITGTINSDGFINIAAGNITNQGNVTATSYISFNATGSFTNGLDPTISGNNAATLNPNIQLVSGTYLNITAGSSINNYATLSSNTDTTLTAANLNNYNLIQSAGNLTASVSGDLNNNSGALIYSGGSATLSVANNLNNNSGAVIYTEGDLTIQGNSGIGSSAQGVNNTSAEITSYAGNILINTNSLTNQRSSVAYQGPLTRIAYEEYGDPHCCWRNSTYQTNILGTTGIASNIYSAGSLTANVTNLFLNDASNVNSGGNMIINAGSFNNQSYNLSAYTVKQKYNNNGYQGADYWNVSSQNIPSIIKSAGSITVNSPNDISNTTTSPYATTLIAAGQTPSTIITGNNSTTNLANGIVSTDTTITNYLNATNGTNNNGSNYSGLFIQNPNPNAPLFETRSQFIDQSQFFGSDYFYTRIGLNLTDVQTQFQQQSQRLVGDQFFQNKIIEEQLRTISKNSFLLSQSETNINNEIQTLLDNATDEYARLGLPLNQPLTQTQINSLNKDIIWFETETIDGATYIVPKIYLSQATRDNLNNGSLATKSTIYGATDVNLTAATGTITNSGSITGNNVSLTAAGNILNKNFSNITALTNLSLTSTTGSITNLSQLQASGALTLNAATDINNNSTTQTNYFGKNIVTSLIETANITAGTLTINAGDNFNNLAASITTTGNANIIVGNDINIATLALHNHTESSWGTKKKGGTDISDTVTNIGSSLNIGGDLTLSSSFDTNIIGSNINVTGNGSLTSDFGNINIANAVNSVMTQDSAWKKGTTSSRSDSVYDYKEGAVESNLNFGGNLTVNAELGTMNLIGSTLKTTGDLNIGSFTVAQNLDGSFKTNTDGTFQTIDGGSVLGVNIKAAELRSEHSETHTKSKLNFDDTLKLALNPVESLKLGWKVNKFMFTPSWRKSTLTLDKGPKSEKTSAKSGTQTITQHSATLDIGGNMMVNSTGDVNIAASNVSVAGSALLNVDGNLNITSAAEKTSSSNSTQAIEIGTINVSRDLAHASDSAGMSGTGSRFEDSFTTTTQKSSNINIGGSLLTNVSNNLAAANSGNLTLTASNLTVGGDSIIKTAGNFSLTDAQDTTSYSSKQSTLEVEVGAKVGNAYVDAGYAWKAVVDAQKKAIQAVEKLKKMEDLRDEGKASDKAVEIAAAQVLLAQTAVATATLAAAAATAGAASAASSSMGTGFYGAGYMNLTSSGVKNTTDTSISRASNFIGYGDIDIASNNSLNVLGSMLASVNGSVTLAATTDIKIEAGTNNLTQNSKQETIYGGGSVGNNGVQLNIGMSNGESNYNKTSYTNSQISAENGTLTLTTGNDANISGANLLAKNITLNIGNNLNVSSKQTEEDSSSNGFGFSFGAGVGAGGNGGNVSAGINMSSADMHRMWTDNITTIKGTDSMAVNVGTDLNLTGAAILSDNLTLAVNGNINKKDLNDSYYSESMSLGVSTSVAVGGNQATVPGTGGQPNQFPGGQASISGSYSENESTRTTYATIGGLNTKLTSDTSEMNNGDFEGGLTVDLRLFTQGGRSDIVKQLNYSKDLATTPFTAAEGAYSSKENNKTEKFFQAVAGATVANTRLLLNQDITAQQLAGDTALVAYEGDSLSADSAAKTRNAFYDSNTDTAALNSSYTATQSDNVVAGKIAHEAIGHKVGGDSEFVAGFVENTVKDNWSDFQSGNANFQLTLPQPTILNNNYASALSFAPGSGVYSDVAIKLDPDGAGGYGHIIGFLQDGTSQWQNFQKFISPKDRNKMTFMAGITDRNFDSLIILDEVPGDQKAFKEQLINDPNVVYIRTTVEQDKKIANAAALRYLHPDPYSLCSKNCLDVVQEVFSAGNVKLPIDFYPGPKSYFNDKLKPYYPDNQKNQSYDK